jgi:Fe-S cluster assembly scaffold protein SufB
MTTEAEWTKTHKDFVMMQQAGASAKRFDAELSKETFSQFVNKSHGGHPGLFPDRRVEDWKYTGLAHLNDFVPVICPIPEAGLTQPLEHILGPIFLSLGIQPQRWEERSDLVLLVSIGGHLVHTHIPKQMADQVVVNQAHQAQRPGAPKAIDSSEGRTQAAPLWGAAMSSLHAAFIPSNVTVEITPPQNPSVNDCPTIVIFETLSESTSPASMAATSWLVRLAPHAQAKVAQIQTDARELESLQLSKTECLLGDGARLEHVLMQSTQSANHIINLTKAVCGEGALYSSLVAVRGKGLTRNHLDVVLDAPQSSCKLGGCIYPEEGGHIDSFSRVNHRTGNANSEQIYKNLVENGGHAVFRGIVSIDKGADGSEAHQQNKSLLLGPTAAVDTKPELRINADEVTCSHGATVGPLADDEIFYLLSRGLSREVAVSLMCNGFLREPITTVSHELATWAQRWLSGLDPEARGNSKNPELRA